ncbi:unnamed protein product [Effrenium voratum]|uniref:Uncharacterized protein n=1 Tax=Effrenium voratum TaxID=2562239 RepID=A0AA36I8M2_9DINO|nr:unnamed protein product [Effrenium voratum]
MPSAMAEICAGLRRVLRALARSAVPAAVPAPAASAKAPEAPQVQGPPEVLAPPTLALTLLQQNFLEAEMEAKQEVQGKVAEFRRMNGGRPMNGPQRAEVENLFKLRMKTAELAKMEAEEEERRKAAAEEHNLAPPDEAMVA